MARTAEQVKAAWSLVYQSYRRRGLIDPNPLQVHLVPQSVQRRSAMVLGHRNGRLAATLGLYEDERLGLPLDAVYQAQLDALRAEGRRLYEVGMLANRRDCPTYRPHELFELMRLGYHYGAWSGRTDLIIGVHPHHAAFYRRLIGFRTAGPERTYGMVREHPVVLLRLDVQEAASARRPPRGLRYFHQHPVPDRCYDERFTFDPQTIHRSLRRCIESFTDPAAVLQDAA